MPEAVIGDFDSIPQNVRAALPDSVLYHVTEQDSTDFEKCKREGTTKDPSVRGTSAAVSGGTVPFYCDRQTKTHAPTMSKHRRGKLCDGIKNAISDRQYDLKLLAYQFRHLSKV